MPKRQTYQEFINKSNMIHNHKYSYKDAVYINTHTKLIITCPDHGSFWMTPTAHTIQRQGCITCANIKKSTNMRLTRASFIERATLIHGLVYDYTAVDYVDSHTYVTILCTPHGPFKQTPDNHINAQAGCPSCAGNKKLTLDDFITKARIVHGNVYDYSNVNWINSYTTISIICKKHGTFLQIPKVHLYNRCGCPLCNSSKGELIIKNILQYHGVDFIQQYSFDDCRYKLPLKFDFYLPQINTLLEFDGIQHFKYVQGFHKTLFKFHELLHRDVIKNNYCRDNNIKLIRINYDQIQVINQILHEHQIIISV